MPANFLLYIDPGTGSMLFSVFIGIVATVFFVLRSVLLKLQLIFSGRKSRNLGRDHKTFVIYNEGSQYYNVYLPVLQAFNSRKINVDYYTSDEHDVLLKDSSMPFVKAEFIGTGNAAFARLNLLNADIVLSTTPGLDVYQWKRSRTVGSYVHLRHGTGDATMYRLFGIDYYDAVLLTGDFQKKDIRTLESQRNLAKKELCTVGCTYLDVLAEKMRTIPAEEHHTYTVLLSPSWGPSAILSRYGERLLEPLLATGFHVILRPHPQSKTSEAELLARLEEKYKDVSNLEWNWDKDNVYAMKRSDIMISDFSSIIYDYTFLCDRPVIYVNADLDLRIYDAGDLPDQRLWQFETLRRIGIELKEKDFPVIGTVLKNASDSAELKEERRKAKEEAWMFRGEAGERVADFMIAKEEEINSLRKDGGADTVNRLAAAE